MLKNTLWTSHISQHKIIYFPGINLTPNDIHLWYAKKKTQQISLLHWWLLLYCARWDLAILDIRSISMGFQNWVLPLCLLWWFQKQPRQVFSLYTYIEIHELFKYLRVYHTWKVTCRLTYYAMIFHSFFSLLHTRA